MTKRRDEWRTRPGIWEFGRGMNWYDFDHFFEGASSAELEPQDLELGFPTVDVRQYEEENYIDTIETFPDSFFPSSGVPLSDEMVGAYDIVYFAADAGCSSLFHHRTARGPLSLSVSRDGMLMGEIEMDSSMDPLAVVPYGGNFEFRETDRFQRTFRREPMNLLRGGVHVATALWGRSELTGVIKMEVHRPPKGLFLQDHDDNPVRFSGELRVFDKRTPTGLLLDSHRDSSMAMFRHSHVTFENLQEAEELVQHHRQVTCSWLHNHTILPLGVTRLVGEFLCPSPVFFFEEGDLCLDFGWSEGVPDTVKPCHSCVVARRRRDPGHTHVNGSKRTASYDDSDGGG